MQITQTVTKSIRTRYKRWNRKFPFTKRQQFVMVTALTTLGLLFTLSIGPDARAVSLTMLGAFTYGLTVFALRDDLRGGEWMTLLTLPTLYTLATAMFYFLLPVRWLTRIPVAIFFAVGMYALLLTENIYNVAANRTIALLRAAHTVGFLLTLVTFFLLEQTFLIARRPFYINMIGTGGIALLLYIQLLWATTLEAGIAKRVWTLSMMLTLLMTELSWILSFWPVNTTITALFLTTVFYATAGMSQQYLLDKLYKKTVQEFTLVVLVVFIVVLLGTHWRGNY